MVRKAGFFQSFLVILVVMMINLISFGIARSEDNAHVIINENLKPGMAMKDAIGLLGLPDAMRTGDTGMVVMPYDSLGLSIEAMKNGTVIEAIHVKSGFKGKFASGFRIGADFKEILSAYNQPDIMTKEAIEYADRATIFRLSEGKLIGADLYSGGSTLFHGISGKEAWIYTAPKSENLDEEEIETRDYGEPGENETEADETEEDEYSDKYDVLDLFGFSVRVSDDMVIVTEIRPDSVAERGGLKVGQRIRKASYEGMSPRNIYYLSGLRKILKRAVEKRKKYINVLQDEHYFHKIRVPKRK